MAYSTGVLGGGISGLTYANLDQNALLLEQADECGGLCRSIREKGFVFDIGSHIIFSNDKEVLDFMLKHLGGNVLTHQRNTKIAYKGRMVQYPFENGLSDLDWKERATCALGYLKAGLQPAPRRTPANFEE